MQVGLSGEINKVYTSGGSSRAEWTAIDRSMHLPLIWYKVHKTYTGPDELAYLFSSDCNQQLGRIIVV